MTTKIIVALLFAIVSLGAGWKIDSALREIKIQQTVIEHLKEVNASKDDRLAQEVEWGKTREGVISAMLAIGADIEGMQTTIRNQNRIQAQALRELIENDKAISEYMRVSVPVNLGLQYGRVETTDPTAYGPASDRSVPTGSMPTTRESATEK